MIARAHRFHGFNSLRHVYSRGRTVRSTVVAIKYLPHERRSSYRAAVVVSRKVHHSAVVRNRIRRRIYEIIRRHEPEMVRAHDIVVTVFSDQTATMEAIELEALITEQLTKAGVIGVASSTSKGKPHAIVERKESPQGHV